MPPLTGSFNANQFEPNQGFGIHPPAQKVEFRITNTAIKETAAKDGGYFSVEFTSPLGTITQNYNIWNKSPKAVEIAHGQLSALCRAVNIYTVEWTNEGAALRNARGLMDVGYQKGEEPSPDNPNAKGYTELKRVYSMAGNDPSRPGQAIPQQQAAPAQQAAPMTAQPGGGWGNASPQQQANPAQANGAGQVSQGNPSWQPGGTQGGPATSPPWGNR